MPSAAITGVLTNAAGSAVGIVSKALLILHTDTTGTATSTSIAGKAATALSKASGTGLGATATALAGGGIPGSHVLEVQYNPNSISLQANANPTSFQYLQQNFDSSIPTQNLRDPSVVLSVELIFDAMNPLDAFMMDKFRLLSGGVSANDAIGAVSGIAKSKTGGYTVQPQTNGLLAALIKDSTRFVTFKWAEMTFTGELTEASATYTMFSVSGKPVRSTVHLNITQQVDKKADITYWDTAFNKTFGEASAASVTGGRPFANRFGNLLNIGF